MAHPLHIVDVFAEARYAGNQLAVVLDAGDLSTDEMQAIARETNYSETTFVPSRESRDGGYDVRIFTPAHEIPFAGHPTLGTAWILRNEVAVDAAQVNLNLGVGRVPVRFEPTDEGDEIPWLTAPPIELGETFAAAPVAAALGLSLEDIDTRFPVQRIHAGIVVTSVPLTGLDALKRSRLDPERFAHVVPQAFPAVHLFCREPYEPENDLAARFYFYANGAREDPATGSATACLGAYLLEHDYLGSSDVSVRVEQGVEIQRPSLLRLKARGSGAGREVSVGGRVRAAVRGELI